MGRYDKIRYYDGSSWKQPNQIKVYDGSSWIDYGTNDSDNQKELKIWNGSSWERKTLNKTIVYGDKQWWCGYQGQGILDGGSSYNLNNNKFTFHCYAAKNYNGDKNVARFGNDTYGWEITWQEDGRIRWVTRWENNSRAFLSDNIIKADIWANIDITFEAGSRWGWLNFGGVETKIKNSWPHQSGGLSCVIGSWGMLYRGYILVQGIDYNGNLVETKSIINEYTVKDGAQKAHNITLTEKSVVSQDTSISWE